MKKGMKKHNNGSRILTSVLMTAGIMLSLTACGSKAEDSSTNLTEITSLTTETGDVVLRGETEEEETGNGMKNVGDDSSEEGTENGGDELAAESANGAEKRTATGEESVSGAEDKLVSGEGEKSSSESDEDESASTAGNAFSESGQATEAEEPTAVSSGYTYQSMSATMYVQKAANVRSIPSKDGTQLGSLAAGQKVIVTGQCNETGWYRISYNGGTGYVSNNYLTTTKPSATIETTTKASESSTTTKASTETTTTAASTTPRTYATEAEKLAIIEGINNYRAKKGYTEMPVVLNAKLTEQAQAWADYLAENDLFEHSNDWNMVGDYYWERESIHRGYLGGADNIIGLEEAVWQATGGIACVHAGIYDCPFIGVGVAVDSEGYSIVVIQGWNQIALYAENGYLDTDKQFDATVNYEFVAELALKIYDLGHFKDFKHWYCYYNVYGDEEYLHIPGWLKGSNKWTLYTSLDYWRYTYTEMNVKMYTISLTPVRNLPSEEGQLFEGALTSGQEVTVTGQCNETGWYRIEFADIYGIVSGYVSPEYLSETKP